MAKDIKSYRVFIASPSGLEKEREAFRDIIHEHNNMDALDRGFHFQPIGWEATLGGVGRPQTLINDDIRSCDYFVLLLWDRWGSPPDKTGPFKSGTEEEYHVAMECMKNEDHPMRNIIVFFKALDPRQLSDPGEQLKQVLDFRKMLENEKTLLYHTFDEIRVFENTLRNHLARWIRDDENGFEQRSGQPVFGPSSDALSQQSETEKIELVPTAQATESDDPIQKALLRANKSANEGKLVEAETEFSRIIIEVSSFPALNDYGMFLYRIGRLSQAEVMFQRMIDLANSGNNIEELANAYGNLGIVYKTQGDLEKAEEIHKKALKINQKLGRLEGMARAYGNLGVVYQTQGDLEKAEEIHKKALKINQKLRRLEGMAGAYGNLGVVYQTQGNLEKAEEVHKKALKINQKLRRLEGMANNYGNLGIVYKIQGDLEKAEEMYKKALKIDQKLGRLEGMARAYGNLGIVYKTQGDLEKAEEMHKKALEINQKLGRLQGMVNNYSNLGIVYKTRGDLEKAEEMYKKALEIDQKLGRLEGMADDYCNLGILYKEKKELDKACEFWIKAKELYSKIGNTPKSSKVQEWLDNLE